MIVRLFRYSYVMMRYMFFAVELTVSKFRKIKDVTMHILCKKKFFYNL